MYAARFAAAQAGLAAADAELAFELCVESMPVEDVPQLTTEQVNRVLAWALNTQKLQEKLMDTSSLINEANLEHTRTLNKVMLQALVAAREAVAADAAAAGQGCAAAEQLLPITVPPAASKPLPVRVEMLAGYDFREQLSEFAFKTLLTRPEVISALSKVRQESTKVGQAACTAASSSAPGCAGCCCSCTGQDSMLTALCSTWPAHSDCMLPALVLLTISIGCKDVFVQHLLLKERALGGV